MSFFPLNKRQKEKLKKVAANGGILGTLGATAGLINSLLGHGAGSVPGSLQYLLAKQLFPVTTRVRLPDIMTESLAKEFAGSVGKSMGQALTSAAMSGAGSVLNLGSSKIIDSLRKTDDIIGKADKKLLEEAYKTMQNVAPTLAKDMNAVRSFLREVALTGVGPDYNTIRQLADAERAIKRI